MEYEEYYRITTETRKLRKEKKDLERRLNVVQSYILRACPIALVEREFNGEKLAGKHEYGDDGITSR